MIEAKIVRTLANCYEVSIKGVCGAELISLRDELFLHCFYTNEAEQRKGYGTQLLSLCKRISRRLNKPLRLTANPFYNRPYQLDALLGYYSKRGFKPWDMSDKRQLEYRGKQWNS